MFPTIGCIAVICFIVCQVVKLTPLATKWVPIISAVVGGVLGVIGQMTGVAELADLQIFDAIATGICSGLVASGAYSLVSNAKGDNSQNEFSAKEQKQMKLEAAVEAEINKRANELAADASVDTETPKEG
jgi:hypothetical protein